MYSLLPFLGATALLLSPASAHGFVKSVTIKGQSTPGADPVWFYLPTNQRAQTAGWNALNQDNGFVEPNSFSSPAGDVNCHKSATPGRLYANVTAGDTVQFNWNTWPDSHKGPILNYIAPCDGDCTSLSPTSLRWTKISHAGLTTNTWATDTLIKNGFTASTTIPAKLAPGNYVIRHEIIALHGAQYVNGAQLYMQCINVRVGGSGYVKPTSGWPGWSLYRKDEPGVVFNLYNGYTSYPVPGMAVWTGAN